MGLNDKLAGPIVNEWAPHGEIPSVMKWRFYRTITPGIVLGVGGALWWRFRHQRQIAQRDDFYKQVAVFHAAQTKENAKETDVFMQNIRNMIEDAKKDLEKAAK